MKRFKFLVLFLSFFLGINIISASTNTLVRSDNNNYGVNKKFKINSYNIDNVKNTPYVDASEKVYDFGNILSDSDEEKIYKSIKSFISKYNIDMVFVTCDFSYYNDSKNEEYASDFYDYNDFGIDDNNYDGIVIYRNAYKNDPYYSIYFFGDVQLYFNDYRLDNLLDDIYSDFHSGNYLSGVNDAISIISSDIESGIPSSNKHKYVDEYSNIKIRYHVPVLICVGVSSLITLIVMIILVNKNKMVKKATRASVYLDKNTINYTEKNDQFVGSRTTHYTVSSSSGGGGGHSSHGSSGGGHSGGGRHG